MMDSIVNTLGKGQSKQTIIISVSITVVILFYALSIGSYFEPDVYRFEDRLTYHQHFENRYFFDKFFDHSIISASFLVWAFLSLRNRIMRWTLSPAIATAFAVSIAGNLSILLDIVSIISLPSMIIISVLERYLHRSNLFSPSLKLILNYLLISVIILASLSIIVSASSSKINDPFVSMLILLSRFSPVLMFLLVFSLPLKIILGYIYENLHWIGNRFQYAINSFESVYSGAPTKLRYGNTLLLSGLGCSATLSVIIVTIPNIDEFNGPIGEDTMMYVNWIDDLYASSELDQISHKLFVEIREGDRPLSILIIYSISLVIPLNSVTIIEFLLPVLLAPSLVLVIYFLTRELTPNTLIALFACFLTAVSFQVIAGMYAGIFANWISLLPAYISLIFLLRFLKTSNKLNLFLFSTGLVILLFTHAYMWTIIMVFVFLFAIVLWIRKSYTFGLLKLVFAASLIVVGIDIAKSVTTGSTLGIARDLVLAETANFGFTQLDAKWSNIVYVSQVFLAGIFGNFILLLLAIYGTMLIRYKTRVDIFILVFISIAILPLFFANKVILSRVLYDIPFQIPAGFAMMSILLSRDGKLKIIAIVLSLLAISIYTVFNIASINQNI